jgi:hypothetical protein
MAEPLYDPEVDAWLESLVETDPDLLQRIEDHIDLLRQEPISTLTRFNTSIGSLTSASARRSPQSCLAIAARRRQFRTRDGGFCHAITFEAEHRAWIIVWALTPAGEAAIVAIQPTDAL